MRVLLTGGSGFVGSHVLRHLLTHTDWDIVCPVSFRHKGLPARVASAVCDTDWSGRVDVVHWDMRAPADPLTLHRFDGCDVIMNVASESHVDRSITDPAGFILNNTALMCHVLDVARAIEPRLFLQMSTDEVYGPAYGEHRHTEWEPVVPSNPYSASKAAQEAIAVSYWRTYGVPVVLTNTMNIIGEMQDSEKYFPLIIRSILQGVPVPVHADANGTPGSRFYLHARNLADAWMWLTRRYCEGSGDAGPATYSAGATRPDRFHVVGERELNNLELVNIVGEVLGTTPSVKFIDFHSARPGHDRRYALDGSKIKEAGWVAPVSLMDSIRKSVGWYLANPEWLGLSHEDVQRVHEREAIR